MPHGLATGHRGRTETRIRQPRQKLVGNLLYRRGAVAPFGVHLQVAAGTLEASDRRARDPTARAGLGAAEEMSPKLSPPLDVFAALAPVDRVFDRRRLASVQNLADDSC